jgi:hypothetical protein
MASSLRAGLLALLGAALLAPAAVAGAPTLSQKHRDPVYKFSMKMFQGFEPVPIEVGEEIVVCKYMDPKSKGNSRGTWDPSVAVVRVPKGSRAKDGGATTPGDAPLPEAVRRFLEQNKPDDAFDAAAQSLPLQDTNGLPKKDFKAIASRDKVPGKLWAFETPSYRGNSPENRLFVVIATFEKDEIEYGLRMYCGGALRKSYEQRFVDIADSFKFFDDKAEDVETLDVLEGVNITAKRRSDIEKGMVKGWDVIVSPKKNYIIIYNTANNRNNLLAKVIADRMEKIRAQVYEVQFPPAAPITAVSICRVCKDAREYHAYGGPGGSAGYWSSGTEELVFYDWSPNTQPDDNTFSVLYHEAFHQYIYYSVGSVAPHSWFNEGHGDYYAGAKTVGSKFKIVVSPFLRDQRVGFVQAAIRQGPREFSMRKDPESGRERKVYTGNAGYTPLEDLVKFSQGEYYAYPMVSYSQGWSLIYFLREVVPQDKKMNEKWGRILSTYFDVLKREVNRETPLNPGGGDGDGEGGDSKPTPPEPPPTSPPEGDPPPPPPTGGDDGEGEDGDGGEKGPPLGVPMGPFFGRGSDAALEKAVAEAFKGVDWAEFEEAWKKATLHVK